MPLPPSDIQYMGLHEISNFYYKRHCKLADILKLDIFEISEVDRPVKHLIKAFPFRTCTNTCKTTE